ncbi:MAG: hypothetical protein Q9170_002922 [Blastenia crenularia]
MKLHQLDSNLWVKCLRDGKECIDEDRVVKADHSTCDDLLPYLTKDTDIKHSDCGIAALAGTAWETLELSNNRFSAALSLPFYTHHCKTSQPTLQQKKSYILRSDQEIDIPEGDAAILQEVILALYRSKKVFAIIMDTIGETAWDNKEVSVMIYVETLLAYFLMDVIQLDQEQKLSESHSCLA